MDDRRFKAKSGERAVNFTKRFRHADRDAQPQLRDLRRLTRTQNVRPERRQRLRAENPCSLSGTVDNQQRPHRSLPA